MPLEHQDVSLELAQKMKELGFKQESLYYYAHQGELRTYDSLYKSYVEDYNDKDTPFSGKFHHWLREVNGGEIYSAYTVAELGEMLPSGISKDGKNYRITLVNGNGLKYLDYATYENGIAVWLLNGYPMLANSKDTEADARAKTLIYLVENGLLKA